MLGVVTWALDVAAAAGGRWGPLIMYIVILAPQRVAGALRRRGGLVDVVRRPREMTTAVTRAPSAPPPSRGSRVPVTRGQDRLGPREYLRAG